MNFIIPVDVPAHQKSAFKKNYQEITKKTDHLFLFAADQKIEHLNDDFFGPDISPQANNPEHVFRIAQSSPVGALAIPLGMYTRYAPKYTKINYIIKLNGKTNLIPASQKDPLSKPLWGVSDVLEVQENCPAPICGIGYTIYPGSEDEPAMLRHAAQAVFEAHQTGLVAILWIYPRGKAVGTNSAQLFAGCAGLANALGADFVKLAVPAGVTLTELVPAIQAAGNTKIICSGGQKLPTEQFLHSVQEQHQAGFAGVAVGRNLFQRPLDEAQKLALSISKIVYGS